MKYHHSPKLLILFLLGGLLGCDQFNSILQDTPLLARIEPMNPGLVQNENIPAPMRLGCSQESIFQFFDTNKIQNIGTGVYEIEDTTMEIPGRWTLSFRDERLAWFVFRGLDQEVSPTSFIKGLQTTRKMIETYNTLLGMNASITRGLEEFRDPSEVPHQGYQILRATWETPQGKVVLNFQFIGESQEYAFLLTLQGS